MKPLEKILYQRLEKIRNELNFYIAERMEDNLPKTAMPISAHTISYQNAVGAIGLFGDKIHLQEDEDNFEFGNKECLEDEEVKIPHFLRSECQKRTIDEILDNKAETFSSMLLRIIDEKGMKDSEVYKKANIDRRLFSKIRGDEDYVPSKKTAIAFCLALQLEMDEAKKLLETAGYALSTSSRFDLIIMYLIENEEYNIHFANIVLEDYGEGTLSK